MDIESYRIGIGQEQAFADMRDALGRSHGYFLIGGLVTDKGFQPATFIYGINNSLGVEIAKRTRELVDGLMQEIYLARPELFPHLPQPPTGDPQ